MSLSFEIFQIHDCVLDSASADAAAMRGHNEQSNRGQQMLQQEPTTCVNNGTPFQQPIPQTSSMCVPQDIEKLSKLFNYII